MMPRKTAAQIRDHENKLYADLRAWYTQPGIQAQLLKKENEAVRAVLELLDRRRQASALG